MYKAKARYRMWKITFERASPRLSIKGNQRLARLSQPFDLSSSSAEGTKNSRTVSFKPESMSKKV